MAKDILLDNTGDLSIKDGDWEVGDSIAQETMLILKLNPGEFKMWPLLGPGLVRLMNGNSTASEMRQKIKLHLRMDKKEAKNLTFNNGAFNIDVEQL